MHWAERSRWTKAFKEQVWAEINSHGNRARLWDMMKARTGKASVRVVFYACRMIDQDNLHGAVKPLIDALKGQAIDDDSPDKLVLEVRQEKAAHVEDQRVEITIS